MILAANYIMLSSSYEIQLKIDPVGNFIIVLFAPFSGHVKFNENYQFSPTLAYTKPNHFL